IFTLLDKPISEASLRGFAEWLRADLLVRLGRFDPAEKALETAAQANPPPPASDLLETRVDLWIARKRFDEAAKAVGSAMVDEGTRSLLLLRTRMAQRADLPPGRGRS